MSFNLHITEEDFIFFNQFHILHSKDGKLVIRIASLTVPVISLLAVIAMYFLGASKPLLITESVILCAVSVICFIGTKKFILKNISKSVVKMKRKGKLPYEEVSMIIFNDSEICENSSAGSFALTYDKLIKLYELNDYLFLYFGSTQAIILPKRCLGDKVLQLAVFIEDKTQLKFKKEE